MWTLANFQIKLSSFTETTSMKNLVSIAAIVLAINVPFANAETPASGLVSERSISTDAALELATTALKQCRSAGYKVSITVLNRHGRTALALSEDGVNPHTLENSERKAYTAFTTRGPSGEVAKRPQPGLSSFLLLKGVTAGEGGLPIFAGKDKELVGSVGISGAPGGEKDAACAQAGIDQISKLLGS
jgi:uncharacterized protein GlcG (DUF336 family)